MYVRCPFFYFIALYPKKECKLFLFSSPHSFFWRDQHDSSHDASFLFLSSLLMLVILHPGVCSARKMFPKRKLDESTSGSESQKEEANVKDTQGQQNKRPRVEPGSPASEGKLSLLL